MTPESKPYFAPRMALLLTKRELRVRERTLTPELASAILGRPASVSYEGESVLFL